MDDIYQELILELYKRPPNKGPLAHANLDGKAVNRSCGDDVSLHIRLHAGKVQKASFEGSGCAISMASASLLASKLEGKTLEELRALGKEDVLALLRMDLSKNPTRMKCALLALDALREALEGKDRA